MADSAKESDIHLGFLATVEIPERGFAGGLLVTNRFGRPLEFQCTTPIKPNRTQEILYGPTLKPYVMSELIGKTLVDKVGVKPDLVLTEEGSILDLRNHVSIAVACLEDAPRKSHDAPAPVETPAAHEPAALIDGEYVDAPCDGSVIGESAPSDAPTETSPDCISLGANQELLLGRQRLRFHAGHECDRERIAPKLKLVPADADMREPFIRVRDALQEAISA